jgi:arsenate reductase (thioredoxin)
VKPRILFLCTGNSCRSQMAEGFLRHLSQERFDVVSAGTEPVPINQGAVDAMAEIGIDISAQRSKDVQPYLGQQFAYVITVCDRAAERCPFFPGAARRLEWNLPDPAAVHGSDADRRSAFREVRDLIGGKVRDFIASAAGSDL